MHQHFCDFAGHYWECQGTALRWIAGNTEPTVCTCLSHGGISMEVGDHSECSIELLACPVHRDDQMRAMGYEPGQAVAPPTEPTEESSMFRDAEGNKTFGFCLWCGCDFYSMADDEAHIADEMAACSVFQELKDEHCMPPVLQAMLDETEVLDDRGDV